MLITFKKPSLAQSIIVSPKGRREIITPGVDLEDGIMKTTQNVIRNRMRMTKLVDDGHTFQLNVKQLYKPIEG